MTANLSITIVAILTAGAANAFADPSDTAVTTSAAPITAASWPGALTERPLTLASGLGELELDGTSMTSDGEMLATVGVAAAFGLTDRLEIEADRHCAFIGTCQMHQTGVHAKYAVVRSHAFEVAVVAGLEDYDVDLQDPNFALRLGATLEVRSGRIALVAAPSINLALGAGNGSVQNSVVMPVVLEYQATPSLALYARSGLDGWTADGGAPLQGFASSYALPLAGGALINVGHCCDVGVEVADVFAAGPGSEAPHVSQFTMYGQLWL